MSGPENSWNPGLSYSRPWFLIIELHFLSWRDRDVGRKRGQTCSMRVYQEAIRTYTSWTGRPILHSPHPPTNGLWIWGTYPACLHESKPFLWLFGALFSLEKKVLGGEALCLCLNSTIHNQIKYDGDECHVGRYKWI